MKKNQLILAVGGGVSAVLVLGSAALAFLGMSGAGEAREAREKALKDLDRYYRANPFPSEENVEASRANLADAENWIEVLDEALSVGTNDWAKGIDLSRATPGEFSSLREETIQSLYDAAPVGEDGSKILSDSFAFGFDRYASGDPAQTPHVRRLLRQLFTASGAARQHIVVYQHLYGEALVVVGTALPGETVGERLLMVFLHYLL